jgi:uncharacterized membrane protein YdfJ with MMPL/SSD domain
MSEPQRSVLRVTRCSPASSVGSSCPSHRPTRSTRSRRAAVHGLLGFSSFGGIVLWLPLFLFVLLFGLSMDYHVFILSRIREQRADGGTTRDAIVGGITQSAGVVTSAAVIMVAVFSVFAILSIIEFKMFGIGTASAILIDATLVRGILLPAGMALLGDRTWYLPRWLRLGPARAPGHRSCVVRHIESRLRANEMAAPIRRT